MEPTFPKASSRGPVATGAQGTGAPPRSDQVPVPGLLFVCTANRCRSPLAEALTERRVRVLGLGLRVGSAGLMRSGMGTPQTGILVAARHGVDLSGHRSTAVDGGLVGRADLVLTMTRGQARELVSRWPPSWPKTFTLRQFLALTAQRPLPRHARFGDAVASLGERRKRGSLLGDATPDDIPDPMGRPAGAWERLLQELLGEVDALVTTCAPLLPAPGRAR